jgi:3-phytase
VDVRYNFDLGGTPTDLVCAGNRSHDTIAVYRVDAASGGLIDVAARPISVGVNEAYGFCLYHSPVSGSYYAFVNDKDGNVEQWELFDNGQGHVDAQVVRSFPVGSTTEGMVADDVLGWLYISEERVGIWRYGAEPDAGGNRTLVDATGGEGHLTADVEGLTIYYVGDGTGYLIASSQGSNGFVIYERQPGNDYVMTFQVAAGTDIDGLTDTDGIDISNVALGPVFSLGVFLAQDGFNDGGNQNFKLVRWEVIAQAGAIPLTIDTTWDPRAVGGAPVGDLNGDGRVGIVDLLLLLAAWGPCPAPPQACPADLDRGGAVGISDLIILLANWGP